MSNAPPIPIPVLDDRVFTTPPSGQVREQKTIVRRRRQVEAPLRHPRAAIQDQRDTWIEMCRAVVIPLLLALWAASSSAEDWPPRRGPNRDGAWTETGIMESLPSDGLKIRWRAPVSWGWSRLLEPTYAFGGRKTAWTPPAFANRHVFARSDKELVCVSLAAEPANR